MKLTRSGENSESAKPVVQQAADWLAALSDESCAEDEHRRFSQWLARSNSHVEEFIRLSALMHRVQHTQCWPELEVKEVAARSSAAGNVVQMPLDAGSARPDLRARLQSTTRKLPQMSWRHYPFALAASVILIIAAAALAVAVPAWIDARHTYVTALGELRSVALEDGSIVELNSQSRVRTRFTAHERLVQLTAGEAIFKVSKDARRPFKVATPMADVVAVGTQFDINAQANQTVVTVIEGRVAVSRLDAMGSWPPQATSGTNHNDPLQEAAAKTLGEHNVLLAAGEQVVVRPSDSISRIARVDPVKATGWTLRRLYFEDTPLTTVAGEFARYSPETIRINDDTLGARRISGTFDSSDPGALVHFLERYADTSVTRVNDGWILDRGNPARK
jgi:transmembrane sensor